MIGRVLLVFAAAMLVLCSGVGQAADWWETFKVKGYVQTDFHMSSDDDADIDIRRSRLSLEGQISDQDYFKLQFDASLRGASDEMKLKVQDAYLVHSFSEEYGVRVGYGPHMISYEGPFSSSSRPFLERSYANGKFNPGEQELNVQLERRSQGEWNPDVYLSYGNGLQKWYSSGADQGSAFLARVDLPFGDDSLVGVSYRTAYQHASPNKSEGCMNFHVVYNHPGSGLSFWGEYYDGDVKDVASDGMYGALVYRLPDEPLQFYYRYDTFSTMGSSDYDRHIVGANYDLTRKQRVTLEFGSWEQGLSDDTTIDARWQIKY